MIKFFFNIEVSHRKNILLYYLLQILSAVLSLMLVVALGNFLDTLISSDISMTKAIMKILVVVCVLQLAIGYCTDRLYMKLQITLGNSAAIDIIYLMNDSKTYIQGQMDSVAEIQKVNNDTNTVVIFCLAEISDLINSILKLIIAIGIIITVFPYGLVAICILFILYAIIYLCVKNLYYKRGYDFKEQQSIYFSALNEQLSHSKFMHLFDLYEYFKGRMNTAYLGLKTSALKLQRIAYLFTSVGVIIRLCGNLLLYLLCGLAVIGGDLSIGDFTIVIAMFDIILETAIGVFEFGKGYQDAHVSFDRIMKLKKIERIKYGEKNLGQPIEEINIKNLNMRYGNINVLRNFNYHFKKGTLYCISGDNGIGKTTLFECILGLNIDDMCGSILFNGVDIHDMEMRNFRKTHITYIQQFPELIEDSIEENIDLFGRRKITKEIDEALQFTQFVDLFSQQNKSKDLTNLSGGERQKVALARGLSECKEVILLDEPTASLDNDSSIKLFKYLNKQKENRIIITITHDRNIMNLCDEIILLERQP